MRLVRKLVACVVRQGADGPELLVVDQAGTHIPRVTLVEGEPEAVGLQRSLAADTGLADVETVRTLGSWERITATHGVPERHLWAVVELRPPAQTQDEWVHAADGHVLRCHWLKLDLFAIEALHPVYGYIVEMLLDAHTA